MSPTHRCALILAGIGLLLLVPLRSPAAKPSLVPKPGPATANGLTYPSDPALGRQLAEAQRLMKHKEWQEAFRVLQLVLDAPHDTLVETKAAGADRLTAKYFISARALANQLLGQVPARGMECYGEMFGSPARALLKGAAAAKDRALLAEVARRYQHTQAGVEASQLLARAALDQGRIEAAAVGFRRLLREPDVSLPIETLFRAALAFRRVGDAVNAGRTWNLLQSKVDRRRWPLLNPGLIVQQMRAQLDKVPLPKHGRLSDWPMLGGDPSRSARAVGSAPFLKARWRTSTTHDELEENKIQHAATEGWVKMALEGQKKVHEPIQPAFFPIAVNGKVIYRSYGDIVAVHINAGQDNVNDKYHAGELAWKSPMDGALASLLANLSFRKLLTEWQGDYRLTGSNMVIENSLADTLNAANGKVYTVDDLAIFPHSNLLQGPSDELSLNGHMNVLVKQNTLRAYHVEYGRLLWQLPGRNTIDNLADSHFLGAPLSVGGKLYVLNEKQGKMQLLCLEEKLVDARKGDWEIAVTNKLLLGGVKTPITQDAQRRMHAVNLAHADGVLVVPTNAGALPGVDLLTQSLLWSHPYQEVPPFQPVMPIPTDFPGHTVFNWFKRTLVKSKPAKRTAKLPARRPGSFKAAPPVIADGKVVFASPDADSIHCVDLHQGAPVWHVERADDLYLAGVFDEKVLLVGKTACRALALKDGKRLWTLQTGEPSGRGIATQDTYYLPLRRGEICALDLAKGRIKAHIKSPTGEAPGNLIFHQGYLLSQTATDVAAYPQLDVLIRQINLALAKDPNDAEYLTERADLRLGNSNVRGAVADLRKAMAAKPRKEILPRTRRLLFEAFTKLLEKDFALATPAYLKEYEEVSRADSPEEAKQRRRRFLYVVGTGYERQGQLLQALRSYLVFADLVGAEKTITAPDDLHHHLRADVWVRGRIAAMMQRATAAQRKALEAEIEKRWQELQHPKKG